MNVTLPKREDDPPLQATPSCFQYNPALSFPPFLIPTYWMVIQQQHPHRHWWWAQAEQSAQVLSLCRETISQGSIWPVKQKRKTLGEIAVMGYGCTLPGAETHQEPASPTCQRWEAQIKFSKDLNFISRTPLLPINPHFPIQSSSRDCKTMSWSC